MRKYRLNWGIVLLGVLILSGCSKLDRGGVSPTNAPPKVYFSNIPPEGHQFSISPRVYWFGTDADGFIAAYQYTVMVKDSLPGFGGLEQVKSFLHGIKSDSASWVDQTALKNLRGVHVVSEPGGTQRNVQLYAEMDPNVYTPQYIFLRAVDNGGEVSEVIHRMYSRNNHRPQAFITDTLLQYKNLYCLVDTTATWKGISISWSGLDTADYDIRNQPEFQFKWELVGPFASAPTRLTVDTTAIVDSSLDSVLAGGKWIYSRWVSEKMHVFKNLKNFGEDQGSDAGYGWYQLRVRTRDDTFVSTDTATTINLRILKPRFRYADSNRKTVLVVDATAYAGLDGGPPDTGEVRAFYRTALDSLQKLGVCDSFAVWSDPRHLPKEVNKNSPGEDMLSRFDLVILLNLGSISAIADSIYDRYKEYLDIGGRLWTIGLNNFRLPAMVRRPASVKTWVTDYFGIDGVAYREWSTLDSTTLEFIRAEPFGLWSNLPTLVPDTTKCKKIIGYKAKDPFRYFGFRGIPFVCYVTLYNLPDFDGRFPAQRRIHTFRSYYGSASIMDDKPCAVNYVGPTFRTAEFTFPLNLMNNEASKGYPGFKVMGEMVKWFWEDLP